MRLSLRIASATVLIIIGLFVFTRQYPAEPGQLPQTIWHFDTTSFRSPFRPNPPVEGSHRRKWGVGTEKVAPANYLKTPIVVPDEGIIVIGKLREEDTAWVSQELAE